MKNDLVIKANYANIPAAIDFIQSGLQSCRVNRKTITRMLLSAEEALAILIDKSAPPNSEPGPGNGIEPADLHIEIKKALNNTTICLSCLGESFEISEIAEKYIMPQDDDEDSRNAIAGLMNKVLGDNIKVSNKKGINSVRISDRSPGSNLMRYTLGALILGLLFGLLVKEILPAAVATYISTNVFSTLTNLFMNALKMIVGPLVFFSILSSVAGFSDLRTLGRMAVKVFGIYTFTSLIALIVGYFTYRIFPAGDPSLVSAVTNDAAGTIAKGEGISVSVKGFLEGIVPDNFFQPFLSSEMLQIIFIAILLGIAVAALGVKVNAFRKLINEANAVFSKATTIILRFMPVSVFCAMANMFIKTDISNFAKIFVWVPIIYIGDIIMILIYCILLAVNGLNPVKFIKGFGSAMITAFTLASSNASVPTSMKACKEKLGISERVYSFSIPFGATVNMDGCCITQIITIMFMARVFGINLTSGAVVGLIFAILALSIGEPGVPGGVLVCIAILLPQVGITADAVSLIMGLFPLVGMVQTMNNVTGDAVVTTIVAKSEGLLDLEIFNAN